MAAACPTSCDWSVSCFWTLQVFFVWIFFSHPNSTTGQFFVTFLGWWFATLSKVKRPPTRDQKVTLNHLMIKWLVWVPVLWGPRIGVPPHKPALSSAQVFHLFGASLEFPPEDGPLRHVAPSGLWNKLHFRKTNSWNLNRPLGEGKTHRLSNHLFLGEPRQFRSSWDQL